MIKARGLTIRYGGKLRATRGAAARAHAGPITRTGISALLFAVALAAALAACSSGPAAASAPAAGWHEVTGRLAGAPYQIDLPVRWNHTLIVWSHGYEPGRYPRVDDIEPVTRGWLLANGYAIAGSGFSSTGWAVADAYRDQAALLGLFTHRYGRPRLTIAVGESLGGLISAGLIERFPGRFSGAVTMCAPLGGTTGLWNQALDASFVLKTLLAPGSRLALVHLSHPGGNGALAEQMITRALRTPAGRARLALAAAMVDVPPWFDPRRPEPSAAHLDQRAASLASWLGLGLADGASYGRTDLEQRARGNPSWNTGVNYASELARSADHADVAALYRSAGLDLTADLATLNRAPRIHADPSAADWLHATNDLTGQLRVPVRTLHAIGDGGVPIENEQAYAQLTSQARTTPLLRQLYIRRAGHCTFTPAERIIALKTLERRINTGHWTTLDPAALNPAATALGPALNVLTEIEGNTSNPPQPPAFTNYRPGPYLRPA
jgi:hypothetical protein